MGRLRLLLRVGRLRGGQLRGLGLRLLLLLIRRLRVRGLGGRLLRVGRLLLLRMRALLVVVGSLALLPIRAGALLPVRRHLQRERWSCTRHEGISHTHTHRDSAQEAEIQKPVQSSNALEMPLPRYFPDNSRSHSCVTLFLAVTKF